MELKFRHRESGVKAIVHALCCVGWLWWADVKGIGHLSREGPRARHANEYAAIRSARRAMAKLGFEEVADDG